MVPYILLGAALMFVGILVGFSLGYTSTPRKEPSK